MFNVPSLAVAFVVPAAGAASATATSASATWRNLTLLISGGRLSSDSGPGVRPVEPVRARLAAVVVAVVLRRAPERQPPPVRLVRGVDGAAVHQCAGRRGRGRLVEVARRGGVRLRRHDV